MSDSPTSQMPASALPPGRPFPGITRTASGRDWAYRLDERGEMLAGALAQAHGLPDLVARVLAGRGVVMEDVDSFMTPRLRDLMPDPDVLRDMQPAVERLARAVRQREPVAIFGDYDVDGACSSALLASFLEACGVSARIHIPDRITEGYGPNETAIRMLAEDGARLLVSVDCGTASHGPFAEAQKLGLDVVVLDHHQAPEALPEVAALVNPNRQDDLSGLGHLCAAGVVFLTLVALNRALRVTGEAPAEDDFALMGALDLVALATVADVVPLTGLNRAFVRQGLTVMRQRSRPGLTALLDVAGLEAAPQAWHLGFLVGPRINAGGRIGDAALGARLLMTRDPAEAGRIAGELDQLNRARQAIEQDAVAEAIAQAEAKLHEDAQAALLVTASPEWHPGIVGLAASRLKERFRRPAFAFAIDESGMATGSGRSIAGVDLGRAVRAAVDAGIARKGGGHAMAAGATVAAEGLDAFAGFIRDALTSDVADAAEADRLMIDAPLTAAGAQVALMDTLDRAGPYGAGCPEPVFALSAHRVASVREVGAAGHLRARLADGGGTTIDAIAFRAAGTPLGEMLQASIGGRLHLAGTLSRNAWGGRERVEMRLVDAALPG
ncbi:MAG: single-stranded-DNA-specific exonuclease RecJ [Salinarimonas sp.]|nr:single-stranded-DNA-specific exonuclease RecJ [Salinarimonas sp.]